MDVVTTATQETGATADTIAVAVITETANGLLLAFSELRPRPPSPTRMVAMLLPSRQAVLRLGLEGIQKDPGASWDPLFKRRYVFNDSYSPPPKAGGGSSRHTHKPHQW